MYTGICGLFYKHLVEIHVRRFYNKMINTISLLACQRSDRYEIDKYCDQAMCTACLYTSPWCLGPLMALGPGSTTITWAVLLGVTPLQWGNTSIFFLINIYYFYVVSAALRVLFTPRWVFVVVLRYTIGQFGWCMTRVVVIANTVTWLSHEWLHIHYIKS